MDKKSQKPVYFSKALADEVLAQARRMAYDNSDGTAPTDFMILVCVHRILSGDEAPPVH
jgi:hypothetical protein